MDRLSSVDELLQRIGARPDGNIWMVLVVDINDIESIVTDLQDTIEIFSECITASISGKSGARAVINDISKASEEYFLLWELDTWENNEWKIFDALRSRLDKGNKGGLLIISEQANNLMIHNAPNFVSWLGARIYYLQKDAEILSDEECDRRLAALQEWTGKTNDDVIALAENRQLPTDPEYGEWLILLDRGDLLERQK
ncbi:ABC transporter permease [Pseudanabaena yagii GIHE-NHR1]|uniref:ABC transporter permease n=1 Tax=Pseudanabaena yagii GIHE-NHR1 TaxID=2722753 RepID=A0ABX1LVV6_9CYAN|nr:ABC transporter permease [Pseudanabaena yagii GIHE-NHR1]